MALFKHAMERRMREREREFVRYQLAGVDQRRGGGLADRPHDRMIDLVEDARRHDLLVGAHCATRRYTRCMVRKASDSAGSWDAWTSTLTSSL